MKKKIFALLPIVIFIITYSCSSSDSNGGDNNDNFDRATILTNIADNIAIPAFQDLQTKLSNLNTAYVTFSNDKTTANLDALSTQWLSAYKSWQYVQMFNIGLAETTSLDTERGFRTYFNRYPVTATDIEGFAASGSYDLEAIPTYNAQGFPALDFLFHGVATGDSNALNKFTSNANANGYTQYAQAIITHMATTNSAILDNWLANYRDAFINNTQSGLNGAFNMIVNDYLFFYEKGFRAEKIGIPVGNFSSTPLPEKVEAFYKKEVSKELALEALTAIENFFYGRGYDDNVTRASFKSYLEFLNRGDLVTAITNQFTAARTSINGLNANFYQQIQDNNTQMIATYDVLQTAVPLLKVDMLQAFNVSVDFTDSDGD